MKLLVDQNLPPSLAARLTAAGQDAHHTTDLGLECAGDEDLFEWYQRNDAVLLTADKRLTKYLATEHASSPSIVIARGYLLDVTRLERICPPISTPSNEPSATRATLCSR